jgi:hypothetical protein
MWRCVVARCRELDTLLLSESREALECARFLADCGPDEARVTTWGLERSIHRIWIDVSKVLGGTPANPQDGGRP